MKNSEEELEKCDRIWIEERVRVEKLKEDSPFGYDYILEILDGIARNLTPQTLFNSGVLLGRLIQVIIENKDEE